MRNRKHHHEKGYVDETLNYRVPDGRIVIYISAERGICIGSKYAIVCKAHGAIVGAWVLKSARNSMRRPYTFCEECRKLRESTMNTTRQGGFRKLKTYHPPAKGSGYEGRAVSGG